MLLRALITDFSEIGLSSRKEVARITPDIYGPVFPVKYIAVNGGRAE
jgi:hypothetical protein